MSFCRKLSIVELKFLGLFYSETPYSLPNILNCFDREFVSNQGK